jgi:hypothetical protein
MALIVSGPMAVFEAVNKIGAFNNEERGAAVRASTRFWSSPDDKMTVLAPSGLLASAI